MADLTPEQLTLIGVGAVIGGIVGVAALFLLQGFMSGGSSHIPLLSQTAHNEEVGEFERDPKTGRIVGWTVKRKVESG